MRFAFRWAAGFWILMVLAVYAHGWSGLLYLPIAVIVGTCVAVAFET